MIIILTYKLTKETYIEYCRAIRGAFVDQPFRNDFTTYIARHSDTKKWFAAIMEREGKAFINLKCNPFDADELRSIYNGITAAFHMNKWHWISIHLKSDVSDELIKQLTLESFRLTESKKKRQSKI